jgi:DNA-directed RNA polymerase subunit K/omega
MKYIPIEEIWDKFKNKYEALVVLAQEVRRLRDAIQAGEIEVKGDLYLYAFQRLRAGAIKVVKDEEGG